MKLIFVSFLLIFISGHSIAGSCCGGSAGSTQIITGPQKYVFRANYQNKTLLADTSTKYQIDPRGDYELESIETTNLSSSFKFNDFWQMGLSIPIVRKTRNINQNWKSKDGLGDISINTAYEFYPEYSRHQFITRGFLYFQLTLPTAPSLFTTKDKTLLDSRGQGHTLYTVGSLFQKQFKSGVFTLQGSFTFRKGDEFKNNYFSNNSIITKDSLDNTIQVGYAHDLTKELSLSSNISRSYQQKIASSAFIGEDRSSLIHTTSFGLNYSLNNFDYSFIYSDDFMIGPNSNSVLGRAIAFGAVKRVNL